MVGGYAGVTSTPECEQEFVHMKRIKRLVVVLFFLGSLTFLMGNDGFCFFVTEEGGGIIT